MMPEINLELIKQQRKAKRYTMQYMADHLKLNNPSAYQRRESGEYKFQAVEIYALSNLLGIPMEKFFVKKLPK